MCAFDNQCVVIQWPDVLIFNFGYTKDPVCLTNKIVVIIIINK